jgi:predicted Na+-dependent transporter
VFVRKVRTASGAAAVQAMRKAGRREIGIHNAVLAIAIAFTVLSNPVMSIPPAVYTMISLFTAAAFGFIVTRRPADEHGGGETPRYARLTVRRSRMRISRASTSS